MTRPVCAEGRGVALAIAVASGTGFVVLAPLFAGSLLLKGFVATATLAYLLYLLARSGVKAGRVTAVAAWAVTTAVSWWFAPSLLLVEDLELVFPGPAERPHALSMPALD